MEIEEEITSEEIEETEPEESSPSVVRRPRRAGIILTVFAAVVLIMVGGLASYYYYILQSEGALSQQSVSEVWQGIVEDAESVVTEFDRVGKFSDLEAASGERLEDAVTGANRDARDAQVEIAGQTGLNVRDAETASQLQVFLSVYVDFLGELRRLLNNVGGVSAEGDFNALIGHGDRLEQAYDDLLLSGRGVIRGNMPRALFDIPEELVALYGDKAAELSQAEEAEKAVRRVAEQTVTSFGEAWKRRDADGMKDQLTNGAKGEFNPGILEDSREIVSLRILNTSLTEENSRVSISSQIEKETPDGVRVTESWQFGLLKQGESWKIDSWKSQS